MKASKALGWLVLLWLVSRASSASAVTTWKPAPSSPPAPTPPRAPPRRRNPFPPQPEPSDADLQVPPSDIRYPLYADLLWIEYAERGKGRPGPLPSVTDLAAAREGLRRQLTEFERWALTPFVPSGFEGALLEEVSSSSPAPRYHRWSLAKLAYDLARKKGAPDSMAKQLQQRVGRSLYEQARDFYRRKP